MKFKYLASVSAVSLAAFCTPAYAQETTNQNTQPQSETETTSRSEARDGSKKLDTVIVTATRREESLQDIPLSVTAFQQEAMSEQGIVSYEGLARETPGVVLNQPTANFNTISTRGIATNGYNANLQSATAIYVDELPISANGNSTILDPTLFDVERVEILRGPQGTLFGANSLSGAVRILTKKPNASKFEASTLVDLGMLGEDSLRQRYNGMINVPLVEDKLALRVVGFYRDEEGWVDNVGTGIDDANALKSFGGRAALRWEPTSNLNMQLTVIKEDNKPKDSGLINPDRGEFVRYSIRPDLFQANFTSYNFSLDYDLGFANLTSSSTYSDTEGSFIVDLGGTYNQLIPFSLEAVAYDDIFVQEARLASEAGGDWDWIVGGFYFNKRRDVDFLYRSEQGFLDTLGLTGLPSDAFLNYSNYADSEEAAAFGEVTYRFSDKFWLTGGLRYTNTSVQGFTNEGGYTSDYFAAVFGGFTNTSLTLFPVAAAEGLKVTTNRMSYKVSASYKPVDNVTTYATVSTGFRSPIANSQAGSVSTVDPNDLIIPNGAESDDLTNYEVGLKGWWLDNKLSTNVAAYYIDWQDIQVQANRLSDQIQFATNIGAAVSKGVEFEIGAYPVKDLSIFLNASINDSEVTELTEGEAAISGAEEGIQLAFPKYQGSLSVRYDFDVTDNMDGFISGTAAYIDNFPAMLPNVPGNPNVASPTYDKTDEYVVANLVGGIVTDNIKLTAYVENLFDDNSITYVHPESFLEARYARVRPRTIGVRISYDY